MSPVCRRRAVVQLSPMCPSVRRRSSNGSAAYAILIGKTNLDQFATGLNGTRSPYGIPANVFNADYISGGSSSGSAVVVAAGIVSFSLGTDTAGSGRVPAAFNNIVGLKPTKGIISTRGIVPACKSQDAVSIFALTVADAAKLAETAVAFDKDDCFARADAPPFAVEDFARPLRIGIPNAPLSFFDDGEYQRLYHHTIDRLAGLGAEITPFNFAPFLDTAAMLYDGPWVAERLFAVDDMDDDDLHPVVREIIHNGRNKSALATFESFYRLAEYRRAADAEWNRMDVMVLPTAGTTYKIADMLADPVRLNSNLGAYTNFVNLLDLSALAIPAGFREDGIPFGVTLIGRAFADGQLAAIGDALHRTLDGAKLGATQAALSDAAPVAVKPAKKTTVEVAVVGAHLRGSHSTASLPSAMPSTGRRRARQPDTVFTPCRGRRRRSRASSSRVPGRVRSKSKSGKWKRPRSGRSWRSYRPPRDRDACARRRPRGERLPL